MKLKLRDKTNFMYNVVPVLAALAHTTFNIQFMHSYTMPEHLEQLAIKTTLVRTQINFPFVVLGHELLCHTLAHCFGS